MNVVDIFFYLLYFRPDISRNLSLHLIALGSTFMNNEVDFFMLALL